jgi:hypothetical protein
MDSFFQNVEEMEQREVVEEHVLEEQDSNVDMHWTLNFSNR